MSPDGTEEMVAGFLMSVIASIRDFRNAVRGGLA